MLFALIAALVLIAVIGVAALWARRDSAARVRALASELEDERERSARLIVAQERSRLAHEEHELIAQRLEAIRSQSALPLDGDDAAERARRRLNAIHRAAEEALGELERAAAVHGEPQPGLAQLPALVERARAAGMPLTMYVAGEPRHIAPGIDASAYRILEEALGNAHRQARGAPATVRVVWRRRTLSLLVRDAGARGAGEGELPLAIAERVDALGGDLQAGRLAGGGFEVRVELPL